MRRPPTTTSTANSNPNPYLRTKVLTASPQELRLMLYDGALRFARKARAGLEARDYEQVFEGIRRTQQILLELDGSLDHAIHPELCQRLSSLYTFIYRLLIDANMSKDADKIDEAIRLLDYERQTWLMLMQSLNADTQPTAADHAAAEANPNHPPTARPDQHQRPNAYASPGASHPAHGSGPSSTISRSA